MSEFTKYEEEAVKSPVLIPIIGIGAFVLFIILVSIFSAISSPEIPDGGSNQEASNTTKAQ